MNATKSKNMSHREYHAAAKSLLSKHPKGTGLVTRGGHVFLLYGQVHFVDAGDTLLDAFEGDEDGWSDAAAIETESLHRAELVQLFQPSEVEALEDASPKNDPILTQAQAQAVYSSVCALNTVGSIFGDVRIQADRAQHDIRVQWDEDGLTVGRGLRTAIERYADQSAFATAYSLQH